MSDSQYNDLDITEDYDFQKKTWRVQRIGWVIMAFILALTLLGGFGSGPLSHAEAHSPHLKIEYERLARYENIYEMKLHAYCANPTDTSIKIWFDRKYIEGFTIEQLTPEPEASALSDKIIYTFKTEDPGADMTIIFYMKTEKIGFLKGFAGIGGEPALKISQFIYP